MRTVRESFCSLLSCRLIMISEFTLFFSHCRYQPSTGYIWVFENDDDQEEDPVALLQLAKKRKRRKILDVRRPGERTEAEEEGARASEAIDRILIRLSKSPLVSPSATSTKDGDDTKSVTSKASTSVATTSEKND